MAESSFERRNFRKPSALAEKSVDYRSLVQEALKAEFTGDSYLSQAAAKAILSGGKRTRAVLALLGCEIACGDYLRAMPVALSFELAHSASLIQDDILDDSSLRHNAPTVHSRYGSVRAILISDYLLFSMFHELSKLQDPGISVASLSRILRYISDSAKMAAKGEFSDMLASTKGSVSEEEYLETAGLKTAALFAASAASGAMAGGANAQMAKALYQYGHFYGIAFQILDDVLDFVGDPSLTGKPAMKDLENNACNIVLVYALGENENSSLVAEPFGQSKIHHQATEVLDLIEETHALEKARELSGKFCLMARAELANFPDSSAKRKLEDLTHSLMEGFRAINQFQRKEEIKEVRKL